MQDLTIGTHLHSQVCSAELIVVRVPTTSVQVDCGGSPLVVEGSGHPKTDARDDGPGSLLGKRYVHAASGLELLCVKPGSGTLSVAGIPLALKAAKQLPASD